MPSEPSSLPSTKPQSVLLMAPEMARHVYGPAGIDEIARITDLLSGPCSLDFLLENPNLLAATEVLFTGWGCPPIDDFVLKAAPRLRAIFFAGGTIRGWVTPAVWARGLVVASAYGANAIPVSEYTLAAILFSLKRGWHYLSRKQRENIFPLPLVDSAGAFGSTVGIVSLGAIGRLVCERLRPFDVAVLACDPWVSPAEAEQLGVTLVSLDEIFSRSDVVSVHTPHLPETEGMITGALLNRLRPGATLINTSRGAVIREDEMAEVLTQRSDLTAVLDVLLHEPPQPANPLLKLPNVMITPHIAGALGSERLRLGHLMIEEFKRWQRAEPLQWQITSEKSRLLA